MPSNRIYERDTDAVFLRLLRSKPELLIRLSQLVAGKQAPGAAEVRGQVRHIADPGSIDIHVRFRAGPILLIENKIDAAYSITRGGQGQPQRYQKSVAVLRDKGAEAFSVLLAPRTYLSSSRLGELFDARVSYEELRDLADGEEGVLLDAAIAQAQTPYEPIANALAGEFFTGMRELIGCRFPTLIMKHDPNADGVRPDDSRTIYFDVPRTLRAHGGVQRPRMSLQCWDSAAPSASVKIMLGNCAALAGRVAVPQDLIDIGGYLRRAGRSLGIVIDTPRLDTQTPIQDQVDDVVEALEASLRLQRWWNENGETLKQWAKLSVPAK